MDLLQLQLQIILGLLFAAAHKTSGQVTEAPGATVTYNPGEECFPYDGSVVPDCTLFIDPNIKQPYYHEHSTNCSRFWECGPDGETCLVECAHCGDESNQQCHYHEDNHYMPALAFDVTKQFPDGPVCNWPSDTTLRCHSNCTINDECCHNDACNKCPNGHCNLDWTCSYPDNCCTSDSDCNDSDKCPGTCNLDGTCSYPDDCCTSNSDCLHFDGMCNVPAPHLPDNCAYCNNGKCLGGCANDGLESSNCPASHPTCYGHVCVCTENAECDNYDGECDMTDSSPYEGHCYYCDGAKAQCVPGCGGLGLDNNHNCPADYECNLLTHQCEETICTEDEMCLGFDHVCNDAHDNCFYCGGCEDLGCCPGCHNTTLNCKPGDVCNMDSHLCENPNQCETDKECNQDVSGICDTGNAVYTECFFCNIDANGNTCEPGCKYDAGPIGPVPSCPAVPNPICNKQTHRCEAAPGHQLLTYIKVTSNGCDGCNEEGLSMKIVGDDDVSTVPDCETVGLDHPGKVDYASVGEFNAVEEEEHMGWGSCYKSPLDGRVSNATVTWTGSGTWRGNSICFGWDGRDSRNVYICTLPAGSSLANGDSTELSCKSGGGLDCP